MKNILETINFRMNEYGSKVAIFDNNKSFTYNELNNMSDSIMNYLNDNGIDTEDIVVIYMERSYLSVCSTLGILKSGAAFLPIDTKTPLERIRQIINLSKAKIVLSDRDIDFGIKQINVLEILNYKKETLLFHRSISPNNLAYVIFTSGSTGQPKGVMIEHGGMLNHIKEKIRILEMDCTSIVAHNASISFDISVWQIIAPLYVGGTIVVFSEDTIMNVRKFNDLLYDKKISIFEAVPTYLNILIDELKKYQREFIGLKYVLSTGEELTSSLCRKWFDVFENILLVNAYGPTETSDDITHFILYKGQGYNQIPIGTPITEAKFTVVNERGERCQVGEKGELLVSGVCVGRGYINNEAETQKSFFYDSETGEKAYRTGDIVSLNADGNYYYFGRKDTQIKIRGNRVDLIEIENTLMNYTGIDLAVVLFNAEINSLNACVVSKVDIDLNALNSYLRDILPTYMIPSNIIKVEEIPVNINGKIDKQKLSIIVQESFCKSIKLELETSHSDNIIQDKLICIITDILKCDNLKDINYWKNDLRKIGFDSANSINLVVKIEEAFNFEFEDQHLTPENLYDFNYLLHYIESKIQKR